MSTLYDPRVSAACLALREDPPAALDGPILQYARDAIAADAAARRADPKLWRRRTFAAIVAFIGVVSAASLLERANPLAPQAQSTAPIVERIEAAPAPLVVVTPARAQFEATTPVAKPKATSSKKRRPPPVEKRTAAQPGPAAASAAIPDEPVQVKTLQVDDAFAPTPIAPPAPTPAVDAVEPAADACVADPQAVGCTPP